MKIAIDLQACLTDSRDRGIGRYAMSLTDAIARALCAGDGLAIAADSVDVDRLRDLRNALRRRGCQAAVAGISYPNTAFSDLSPAVGTVAGMMRSRFLTSVRPDAVLVTSFFEVGSCYSSALDHAILEGIPTAVIAYDIIPLLFPEQYLPEGEFIAKWYRDKVEEFKRFDHFLAISEATRDDLIRELGIAPERITVIGAGLDFAIGAPDVAMDEDRLEGLGITEPFVLMVGNADWRKNCIGALEAFAGLPPELRRTHQLVFTQVGDDVRAALRGKYAHLRERVVIAGKVCDRTLGQLYARCRVFFFPSLYEGFGLPVLEAMASRAPVLSSNRGALAEVVHDKQVLFDPGAAESGVHALKRVLEDDAFRGRLLDGARDHALTFTWERCARLAIEAMCSIARARPASPSLGWRPEQAEIGAMADACIEAGPASAQMLRQGLQAIAAGGARRILVDITEVVRRDARSGIQRVVRNYVIGLLAARADHPAVIVEPIYWSERGIRYARSFTRERLSVDCQGEDDEVDVQANDLLFMLDSSWWSPERFDALKQRVWSAGGEVVWMVYDLVPINVPQHCDPVMPPVFRAWLDHVVRLSDGFVCISEATRADLEAFMDRVLPKGERRPWTRSLHLGSDLESGRFSEPSSEVVAVCQSLSTRPWLLALGTLEPRKDYVTIIAAYERLWAEGADVGLVIVGKQGWNVESFAAKLRSHPEFGKRLYWLEGISDGDVRYLLSGAAALIQASIAEGFGLPVVEAGSLGVPLLLSDIPVFREIAGDDASYFPVGNSEALATLIAKGAGSGQWKHPQSIRTMTWRESASKLENLLLGQA